MYLHLSLNWGSVGHFEVLNESKSQLVQNVWHKMYTEAAQDLGWIRDWSSKFTSDKWTFYNHFWPFLCQLYENLSQNRDSDGHFEVLNKSESWLVQQLWHKMQIKPKKAKNTNAFFSTISQKNWNGNICILSHNFWFNQGLDLLCTSKWPSEPQFCEI